jgi:hypothetical protein
MKHLQSFLFSFGLLTIFASCSGIRNMQVQVMRPARITVPQEIKSIGILNRSIPTNISAIEGTLTGETPRQDKKLSEECLQGLVETLNTSSRFTVMKCEEQFDAADEKSLTFGSTLSWETVDSLCEKYKVDGLLVLEFFDTDYLIANPISTAREVVGAVLNGGSGGQVEVRGTAKATAGYRVYAPKTRSILYEDRFKHSRFWVQRSVNPVEAVAKLIKRNEALMAVSKETGYEFAMNIVPLYFWEHRDMYKGKKGDLERGERQALAKDWQGAIETWERVYNQSGKSKERAKAAFNVALGYEVRGDLNQAQTWVQRAYVEGGKKAVLNYSNILDQRVREQGRLNEQKGNN